MTQNKRTTIILDAGHGGIDQKGNYTTAPAKMAKVDGVMRYEGVMNRTVAGMLGHLLTWSGYNVIYTVHPNDSRDISLGHRVRVANSVPGSLMVSIHFNAFNGKARGFEIYTSPGETRSDGVAQSIFDEVAPLARRYGLPLRVDKSDGDSDKEADFYVLRKTRGRSVLVECSFFDNRQDLALYDDKKFLVKFVSELHEGILKSTK